MVSVSALAPLASALFGLIKLVDSDSVKKFFESDKNLINKLKIELLTAEAVLSDAEEKQITNPKVKEWLNELKYAAYDADDLLDVATTDALKRKMENKVMDKVMAAAKVVVERSSPIIPSYRSVRDRLIKIIERLENLAKRRDLLNLKGSARVKPPPRHQTTSLLDESEVFGRDEDKEKLIEFLLSGTAQESGILVIAIVGIPGVGKTTLAQLLYNDYRVKEYFSEGMAWVHVSEELDVFKVTRTIFESVVSQICHVTDLNVLQVTLKTKLSGKRFLLVLDDIWNENLFDWDLLSAPFKAGARGSRIIVTTRNQGVASIMRAIATHHLPQLSEECCQKLFEKYAFGTSKPDDHPNLKSIGHDIAKKCQGLPLAAKTLGSLLHSESETKQWRRILHSKRYKFEKKKLILMWMAEGFLQQPNGEETMEEIGDKYFLELLSRSFFQASTHSKPHYVMHDLVIDLAQFASGEFCFKLEAHKRIPEKARHLALLMNGLDVNEKFEALLGAKSLRTLLLLGSSGKENPPSLRKIISEKKVSTQLRVLSCPVEWINVLPDLDILPHLRYLDFSNTLICVLPPKTCSLYNMQTLLLSNCRVLTGLPKEIIRLTNLRHLDVSMCPGTKLPPGFGELTNLQTLADFWVGKAEDSKSSKISELGRLSCLRELSISRLENVENDEQALKANLSSKNYLCELKLSWSTTGSDHLHQLKVLENLEPHTNLEKLTIEKYGGNIFPIWLSSSNFRNMVILKLTKCSFCESLPSLGNLLSLQQLYISEMNNLESVTFESDGDGGSGNSSFRSLKILSFIGLKRWTMLTCNSQFPSLQQLTIEKCDELTGDLPDHTYLPRLQDLKLSDCPKLSRFSVEGVLPDSISTNSYLETLGEQVRGLTSLKELQITSLSISTLSDLQILGKGLSGLTSLKKLNISNCKMPAELPNLQSLAITDCKEWEERGLYRMELPTCSETTNGYGGEKESSEESWLPATLTSLCINIRPKKQCDSRGMELPIDFEITGKCNEERSFPEDRIPLRISSHPDLKKLVKRFQHLTSLKRLEIKRSMSIQAEGSPTSLSSHIQNSSSLVT